ncbi:hypothetical protein [Ethanoligenens sp.]|uniref:hypothetical protein n=1 Tax=Ethanoligenens sp. TaxID=2099655 RepID=UPI0039E8ADFA
MTADFNAWCANAPLGIRKDAQPPRVRGVRKSGRKADFAPGVWGRDGPQQADRGHTVIACQAKLCLPLLQA